VHYVESLIIAMSRAEAGNSTGDGFLESACMTRHWTGIESARTQACELIAAC